MTEREFDAVLLMGASLSSGHGLPHRKAALQEVSDRLRAGGLLFSAFISRFGVMGDLIKNLPDWIEDQDRGQSFLARGKRPDEYPPGGFRGYFARVSEIRPRTKRFNSKPLRWWAWNRGSPRMTRATTDWKEGNVSFCLDLLYKINAEQFHPWGHPGIFFIGRKK